MKRKPVGQTGTLQSICVQDSAGGNTITLLEVQGRLHEIGENITDERYKDILLQGLDYEFVKMTSFHSPTFGIDEVQPMMRNLYIDRLSTP